MKKLLTCCVATCAALTYTCMGFTAVNPITVTYLRGTTEFSTSSSGSAYYVVAVNADVIPANVKLSLSMTSANSTPGLVVQQITSATPPVAKQITLGEPPHDCGGISLCGSTFALSNGQSCCLGLKLTSSTVGSYTIQPLVQTSPPAFSGQAPSALSITVSGAFLLITPSTLALSVPGLIPAAGGNPTTGTPRVFTIQNIGPETATGVACPTSTSPSIASITCVGCGTIPSGSTCMVTITPTTTPSAAVGNTSPTPITLTIQGTNTNTLNPAVNVLTYGSFYQAGYLFSIIETTDTSASIGGTVAAEVDAVGPLAGVFYSPPNEGTTSGMYSDTNGASNTMAMVTHYGIGTNYSAGHCISNNYSSGGYADWYLPAICEMGYGSSHCGNSPGIIPNMQSNLLNANTSQSFNFVNNGIYWSSTAVAQFTVYALYQQFAVGGGSGSQMAIPVNSPLGVRCVRVIT